MESLASTRINSTYSHSGSNHYHRLVINPTKVTPAVNLFQDKQYLLIKGRSCPDNALAFYTQVYSSLENYVLTGNNKLNVFFKLEYFNTSSAKCIYDLFKRLQSVHSKGVDVVTNWYYENNDEDMLEAGEDFSEFFKFKFNLVPFEFKG